MAFQTLFFFCRFKSTTQNTKTEYDTKYAGLIDLFNKVCGVMNTAMAKNETTKQEEEVGVNLKITPSINLKKNEITLNIEPELKEKTGEVQDPAEAANKVPIISVSVDNFI